MSRHSLFSVVAAACLVAPMATADDSAVADPALSGWINGVLSQNPEVQAAQAAVDAAGGRLHAADQPLFNPELEFEYESSDVDTTTGGISQTIDWSGKREARAGVARSGQAAAVAELRARRQALATDLLRALADWRAAQAIARVSEKQGELMARFARLAEQRRQAGDLGQVELDLAHLAAADAAFVQSNADGNLLRARRAMNALTGSDHAHWPALTGIPPDLDPERMDTDRLLAGLPALQAALARVAAARASVQVSLREKRPDPTIGIRAGKEDSDTLTGITLSVPLFVRNDFNAEVDVASAGLIQAEQESASLRQQARAELLASAQVYQNARRAWKAWEAAGAPRLSQRTELLDRLWQAGELNTTDYLVQLKQALQTEVSAMEQHGRMWRAWADWLAASGRIASWLNLAGENP
jgi:cobalt-zinc-cadmium efflux system outer membrane protein